MAERQFQVLQGALKGAVVKIVQIDNEQGRATVKVAKPSKKAGKPNDYATVALNEIKEI